MIILRQTIKDQDALNRRRLSPWIGLERSQGGRLTLGVAYPLWEAALTRAFSRSSPMHEMSKSHGVLFLSSKFLNIFGNFVYYLLKQGMAGYYFHIVYDCEREVYVSDIVQCNSMLEIFKFS